MSRDRSWLTEEGVCNTLEGNLIAKSGKTGENATEHGESDLRERSDGHVVRGNKKRAVLASLESGTTVVAACRAAGVANRTFYKWRAADPEFKAAAEAAQGAAVAVVEDSVFRQATGADGGKPNIVAAIFWLCNRAPERWKHVNKVEVSGADGQDLTVILRGMAAKRDELAKRWGGDDKGDGLGN